MSLQDPVADMLTRIRNAQKAHHREVSLSHSKYKESIAKVLLSEGYLSDLQVQSAGNVKTLVLKLRYYNNRPVIEWLKRVSRPGLRRYANVKQLPRVLNGYGVAIISTSKGVMTDAQARKQGLGGEIIAMVQ